eukprot:m.18620 g.18620  ORF g.18620 m.18620 type:complete len:352 (-) comp5754_c0_seq1:70-1125(-)
MSSLKFFAGNSNKPLASMVAGHLDVVVGNAEVKKFANQETSVRVLESVRDADVFIMQSGCGKVNDSCMELFIMLSACRIASARRIVGVVPYFPYSKQSKQKKRGTIPAKLVASLMKVAGVTHLITLDLHHMQMQGFFDVPIDNVKMSPVFIRHIREKYSDKLDQVVIVAKNAGASKRAALVAKRLRVDFAMIFGEQTAFAELLSEERLIKDGSEDAAGEEGEGKQGLAENADEETWGSSLIGDVEGRITIMIDDMIDTAKSFVQAAELLKANGARQVLIMATHGLLSGDCPTEFEACNAIDEVVVTNSIPQDQHMAVCSKIKVLDCSHVLAEVIRRVHFNESMASMYTQSK